MCEKSLKSYGITYTCCLNYYYNGSSSVRCRSGYFGNDCIRKCEFPSYGDQCIESCSGCDRFSCHYTCITGCLTDYSQSSQSPYGKLKTIRTQQVPSDLKTPLSVEHFSSITEKNPYRSDSISKTKAIAISNYLTTDSNLIDASIATPTNIPLDTNILIVTVGGVLAMLLSVLISQHCSKLRLRRRKYAQQMSMRRRSLKEEEVYEEINESSMTEGHFYTLNDHQQLGKYIELQTANQSATVQYEKMKTELHYQEVNESSVLSSTSSDSNNSNTSYLIPRKTNNTRNFIDVLDSSAKSTFSVEDSHITLTEGSSNKEKGELSEYLDPIFDPNIKENVSKSSDIDTNNDVYLAVTTEPIILYI